MRRLPIFRGGVLGLITFLLFDVANTAFGDWPIALVFTGTVSITLFSVFHHRSGSPRHFQTPRR
jgi:hypothetical protein